MAFYSVRINDAGEEIETTRQTYRTADRSNFTNRESIISSRGSTTIGSFRSSTANTYRTVRYVNPAVFIEKNVVEDNITEKQQIFDCVNKNDHVQENNVGEKLNYDVPLLDINLSGSSPSSDNLTYSYRKVCEATRIIQKPDAYNEWLLAKKSRENFERKQKEDQKRKEKEERELRRIVSEEKFKEWLEAKSKIKNPKVQKTQSESQISSNKSRKKFSDAKRNDSTFKAWLNEKIIQQNNYKKKLIENHEVEKQLERQRKEEATESYGKWLKDASKKPKPVPLNRGLYSLKGSLSDVYVNPTPWITEFTENNPSC